MKLIEQITLVFKRGRSEKVYEVDLCEVGPGRFVVNYRYGRRGATLKDGTKTLAPVSEEQARREYDKLVASKQKAGYEAGSAHAVAPAPPPAAPAPAPSAAPQVASTVSETISDPDPRRQAVLARLARGDRGTEQQQQRPRAQRHLAFRRKPGDKGWRLERAIWRAGELKIGKAAPLLANLVGSGEPLRDYAIAWSLGRCGNRAGTAALITLRSNPRSKPMVQRMATAALLELYEGDDRLALQQELATSLPESLRTVAIEGPPDEATDALRLCLASSDQPYANQDPEAWAALETLYLMNTASSRPAVLDAARNLPLRPPAFQRLRALFKLAEFRRDGQLFGIIAHRFEKTAAMYKVGRYGYSNVPDRSGRGRSYMSKSQRRAMMASDRPTAAYSSKTRWYLRQRVWRTLKRMAELEDTDYVPMAVGVLLPFTDGDAGSFGYYCDKFGGYWALNHILYLNSPRYTKARYVFHVQSGRRGGASPTQREEAFPQLWDRQPTGLLHLLAESGCEIVHEFAVRCLRAQTDFCASLPIDVIAMMLSRPYELTQRFGFELAQRRYRPGADPAELRQLAVAVAGSIAEDIRREGHRWIRDSLAMFLEHAPSLAALAACPHQDTRLFMRTLLSDATLSDEVAKATVGGLVAHLLGCADDATASDIATTLQEALAPHLVGIGGPVIEDLVTHELAAVQIFSAQLMLLAGASPPSETALQALLESKHEAVRPLGARVLSQLDDAALLTREKLLWSLCTHSDGALRAAIRPAIKRLAQANTEFGSRFLQMLIASLLRRRLADGVPSHVVKMLREDFAGLLNEVPSEVVWRLLRSESTAAQELGGVLLPKHLDPNSVDLSQIVELSNHKVLSVRQAGWHAAEQVIGRLKGAMATAVRLLDAKWEDSRVFAFKLFEARFSKEDFTPIVLVSICDSVRPDTQRFGRKMITRHFDESAGDEYLRKLSEHPSTDVQLFATNYLERYASDSAERMAELAPYFIRILSAVNRGRAARKRAHAFLRSEALKNEDCAAVVAEILTRQSATIAIEDRASAIETMAAIARTWPQVALPIRVEPPELRATVRATG